MFSQNDERQPSWRWAVAWGLLLGLALTLLLVIHRKALASPSAWAAVHAAAAADAASAQAAADEASIEVERGVIKFYFSSGSATLPAGAAEALADLVKNAVAGRRLVVMGFHDASGRAAQNAALAKQRALAVRDALRAAGVPAQRIEIQKPQQMMDSGSDAEARRVEVSLQ